MFGASCALKLASDAQSRAAATPTSRGITSIHLGVSGSTMTPLA